MRVDARSAMCIGRVPRGGVVAQRSKCGKRGACIFNGARGARGTHAHARGTRSVCASAPVLLCVIVVIGIIKIRGLKLFRFMPALLSSCRRVGDEARFDSGEQISCIIQDPDPGAMQPPRSQWKRSSLGKKSFFNLSSRPNNARVGPLASPLASEERKTLYGATASCFARNVQRFATHTPERKM